MKYTSSSFTSNYRAAMIGTVAEVSKYLSSHMSTYFERILPSALECIQDSDAQLKRNSIYCITLLLVTCPNIVNQQLLQQVLYLLQPLFQGQPKDIIDNAVSGVLRIVHKFNIPLDNILPAVMAALPLKEDFAETTDVYKPICFYLQQSHPLVLKYFPFLLNIFGTIIETEHAKDVKNDLIQTLHFMKTQRPSELQSAIITLPQDSASIIMKYL